MDSLTSHRERTLAVRHHNVVLNIGIGRSGTTFCANALRQLYGDDVAVEHEPLSERRAQLRHFFRCYGENRRAEAMQSPIIRDYGQHVVEIARQRPAVITGGTIAHLAPVFVDLFGEHLRVVHLHRHPVNVASAAFVSGRDTDWSTIPPFGSDVGCRKLTPLDPHVRFVEASANWEQLGRFGRISYQWLERVAAAEEFPQHYPSIPFASLRAESDVFASDRFVEVFSEFINHKPKAKLDRNALPRNPTWERLREEAPLGDAWMEYSSVAGLVEFATQLGYTFNDDVLESETRRYQLPHGIAAWLRHSLKYWQLRRRCATYLRKAGVVAPARPELGGGTPRKTSAVLHDLLSRDRFTVR